jgi:uncharacterized protein
VRDGVEAVEGIPVQWVAADVPHGFFDALNPITHLEAYKRDVAIAFLCGAGDLHVPAEAPDRFRTALRDRDPRAADRVRVDLYEDLDHLDAAQDERLYSAALEWLAPAVAART